MVQLGEPEEKNMSISILGIFKHFSEHPAEEVCTSLSRLIGKDVYYISSFYSPTRAAFRVIVWCVGNIKKEYTIGDEVLYDYEANHIRDIMDGFHATIIYDTPK